MRRQTKDSFSHLSELNVTPMLDLAFVLLIIFMITAPFLEKNAKLIIPTTRADREAVRPSEVFTLALDSERHLKLNGVALEPVELMPALQALRARHPKLGVVIRCHKDLPVQELINVMDVLKRLNITKVGLPTQLAESP